jgi:hypothetical protein
MWQGWRRTLAVLTSITVASMASPAGAQPVRSAKDRQAANALVTKAIARAEAGDHDGAIELYRQAYNIVPDPALLTNIGAQLAQNGKAEEALHFFCMYIELAPGGSNVPFASSQAKALQGKLGNQEVDDDNVCAPAKPVRAAMPPIEAPGSKPAEEPPDEGHRRPVPYAAVVTGAAGLAAVGVGVFAGIKAKSISDQITHHPINDGWQADIKAVETRGQRYEYVQIGALIGGGVLIATSAVLFIRASVSHDKPSVAVAPTTNGFAVLGTF